MWRENAQGHNHQRKHPELGEQQRESVDKSPVQRGLQRCQPAPAGGRLASCIAHVPTGFVNGLPAEL